MTGCFRGVIMCLLRRRFMNIYELSVLPGAWTAPPLPVTPPPPLFPSYLVHDLCT